MKNYSLQAVIEAVLFAGSGVVSFQALKKAVTNTLGQVSEDEIRKAVEDLKAHLDGSFHHGIQVVWVKDGLRLQTRPELRDVVQEVRSIEAPRLSRAAMETLAIVAYRQPITRAEIEEIRGVDTSTPIRFLLEKGLIRIVGRKQCPGRPLIYRTSDRFLDLFGLKDLKELPEPRDISRDTGQPARTDPSWQ